MLPLFFLLFFESWSISFISSSGFLLVIFVCNLHTGRTWQIFHFTNTTCWDLNLKMSSTVYLLNMLLWSSVQVWVYWFANLHLSISLFVWSRLWTTYLSSISYVAYSCAGCHDLIFNFLGKSLLIFYGGHNISVIIFTNELLLSKEMPETYLCITITIFYGQFMSW